MLFQLFLIYLKIGIFTFGGPSAMVALTREEMVATRGWLTNAEFTDLLAVSESIPGPLSINTAAYSGYLAMLNSGHEAWLCVIGGIVAAISVMLLPITAMILITRLLLRKKDNSTVQRVISVLRVTALGIIAAAAISLITPDSFGTAGCNRQFIYSVIACIVTLCLSIVPRQGLPLALFGKPVTLRRPSPIIIILVAGAMGIALQL